MTNTPPEDPDGDVTPGWRTVRPSSGGSSPTGPPPPAYGAVPGGYPTGPPPSGAPAPTKSHAPLFIILGVIALVAVLVIAIVGVGLLRDDSGLDPTTTTEDTQLADARQDLRAALEDDDREQVASIIDDNPDLLDDATDTPRGETTPVTLDDEDGLGFATVAAAFGEGFRATSATEDVGGLVLDPGDEVVGALDEVIEPLDDGDHPVLLFSMGGDGADVDLTVNRITNDLLFVDDEVDGTIETAGDVARYEIDLEAAAAYSVTLEGDDTTATISDPDGSEVDSVDGGADPLPLTAADDGTYVIEVTGVDDATPSFTLSVDLALDFTLTNLSDGERAEPPLRYVFNNTEETDGQSGLFRVNASAGVTILVTCTPSAGGDVALRVVRPGQADQVLDNMAPGQPESYQILLDGPTPLDFETGIVNSVPDTITVTVESVG